MTKMTFENDNWSKKIIVTVREQDEETKFDVEFFPTHTRTDFDSPHYILFRFFFEALNRNSELEVTAIEWS